MSVFPSKVDYATGDILTATDMNEIGQAINLLDSAQYAAGKNKFINGDFNIWQRGTSTSTDGSYGPDRWLMNLSGATASFSRQAFTVGQTDVPGDPTYFARYAVTTGDNSCRIEQRVEDVTKSSSETFTISFWAKGTNPAGGSLEVMGRQEFGVGGGGGSAGVTVSAGTIVLTGSWQRFTKTFTFASVSGKTIVAGNWYGVDIRQPATDTGAAAWTLDISNVQLELGTNVSNFQTASGTLQGELALCQRYLPAFTTSASGTIVGGYSYATNNAIYMLPLPVNARVAPTGITLIGNFEAFGLNTAYAATPAFNGGTVTTGTVTVTSGLTITAGQGSRLSTNGAATILFTGCEL
jgi:hypothetical protein